MKVLSYLERLWAGGRNIIKCWAKLSRLAYWVGVDIGMLVDEGGLGLAFLDFTTYTFRMRGSRSWCRDFCFLDHDGRTQKL